MRSDAIAKEIGTLVDHLRASDEQKISLTDIAAATEVLLQATQMYFKTIDTSVFADVRQMSDLISQMKTDIAFLRPDDLKEEQIPRAGMELDAVVKNTEEATNTIMEAAEEIMAVDFSDKDSAETAVNDSCMRIFEACSFQDITGQRVDKVVKTLTQIEDRLDSMRTDWMDDLGTAEQFVDPNSDTRPDADLLHGPALGGEGVDQSEVDALLNGDTAANTPADDQEKSAEPEKAEEIAAVAVEQENSQAAPAASPEKEVSSAQSEISSEPPKKKEAVAPELPKAEKAKPKAEPEAAKKTDPKAPKKAAPEAAKKAEPGASKKAAPEKAAEPVSVGAEDEEEKNSQADIDALFD
ncbi:MAG: protein phosphatase CheZ [Rhodospirillales bacterium]|nr:protein phosphatase CheZ [Rhodospirillales bacterium]